MKLVATGSGEVFEPAYIEDTRMGIRWWPASQLRKDGKPSLRHRSQWVGDFYALYDAEREAQATPVRERIAQLKAELTREGLALAAIYKEPEA